MTSLPYGKPNSDCLSHLGKHTDTQICWQFIYKHTAYLTPDISVPFPCRYHKIWRCRDHVYLCNGVLICRLLAKMHFVTTFLLPLVIITSLKTVCHYIFMFSNWVWRGTRIMFFLLMGFLKKKWEDIWRLNQSEQNGLWIHNADSAIWPEWCISVKVWESSLWRVPWSNTEITSTYFIWKRMTHMLTWIKSYSIVSYNPF